MKIVRWSYEGLHVPMLEDDDGELWVSPRILAGALGVPESTLRKIRSRHADEMTAEDVTDRHTFEFLKKHKVEFGFGRSVQKTTVLVSQLDMLIIAQLSKSQTSKEFRKAVAQLIKEQATTGYVLREDHDKVLIQLGQTVSRLDNLERPMGLKNGAHVKLSVVHGGLS